MMPSTFEPLNEKRVFEQIVEILKQKIFSGEYRPGDRLPTERDLAEALRVSRLSVREAYRALSFFGMLEIKRGNAGGAFIRVPPKETIFRSISDFFQIQGITLGEWVEARLHLELAIGEMAVNKATDEDFLRLEQCIQAAMEKIEKGIPAHEENVLFHQTLSEISGNRILHTAYHPIMDLQLTTMKILSDDVEQTRDVALEHEALLSLLKARNVEKFLSVLKTHVLGAGQRLHSLSERSPLFVNQPINGQ